MAVSNKVMSHHVFFIAINFIAVLLSIAVIVVGLRLAIKPENACVNILQHTLIIVLGILMLILAIVGFVGGLWRLTFLFGFCIFFMVLLVVMLGSLVAFGYSYVTDDFHPEDYPIDDFSEFLKGVISHDKWDRITTCLRRSTSLCNQTRFFHAKLSPLEPGCCKPPSECGYTFVNPTHWIRPIRKATHHKDCLKWSNNQTKLCYECDSCKCGLLQNLKTDLKTTSVLLTIISGAYTCVLVYQMWYFN